MVLCDCEYTIWELFSFSRDTVVMVAINFSKKNHWIFDVNFVSHDSREI